MQSTEIDLLSRPALAPRARLRMDAVGNEPVLLYPEGLLRLNPTAHEVLSRCDGKATVGEIVAALCEEFEADPAALRADVLECLAECRRRQVVTFPP